MPVALQHRVFGRAGAWGFLLLVMGAVVFLTTVAARGHVATPEARGAYAGGVMALAGYVTGLWLRAAGSPSRVAPGALALTEGALFWAWAVFLL